MTNYKPAEVFPPGEFIHDELKERGWTQGDLADIMGRPASLICNIINGKSTRVEFNKLPHYKATCSTLGVFAGASGVIYIYPDDNQGTGLTIQMAGVGDTVVPYMKHLQGIININAHALSTVTPKWLSVRKTTDSFDTSLFYSFLLRDGVTPGAIVDLNT
jgi:transcriptional regulator with XRE-family HTH domain